MKLGLLGLGQVAEADEAAAVAVLAEATTMVAGAKALAGIGHGASN